MADACSYTGRCNRCVVYMDPRSAKMFVLVDLAILTESSQNTSAIFGEDSPK